MKRQPLGLKSGFTLVELMIVITIFWVFVLTTNIFNYAPKTEAEKADRMIILIWSMLKTELQNVFIGRMPNRDGKIATRVEMRIGTWGITASYYTWSTGTTPFIVQNTLRPFFNNDTNYEIRSVIWTGSSTVPIGHSGTWILILENSGLSFSGAWVYGSWFSILEIKVGYMFRTRKIILDRRTGKLTEINFY